MSLADLVLTEKKAEQLGRKASSCSTLVSILKLAFNPDFTQYVNHALKQHEMPVDPDMNWAKWIEAVYRNHVSPESEELRDEAIHYILVLLLYEKDILAKFDPKRLKEETQKLPLEKQITSYLKYMLICNIRTAVKYLTESYHRNDESLLHGDSSDSMDELLQGVTRGHPNPQVDQLLESDIRKLRHAFHTWVDNTPALEKKRELKVQLKNFFDLITLSDAAPAGEMLEQFAQRSHLSRGRAKQILYIEMPRYLRMFANSPDGKTFGLAKRIPAVIDKKKHEQDLAPAETHTSSLEDSNMSEQKKTSEATLTEKKATLNRFATFNQIANEDPGAMGEALSELTAAFHSLAEASEALVENLDLTPVPKEGSIKDKVAAKKKFAAALKRIAGDDPERVEEAMNEIYNAVDEVAFAIENLAENLGFELGGTEEVDEFVEDTPEGEVDEFVEEEEPVEEEVEEEKFEEIAPKSSSKKRGGIR